MLQPLGFAKPSKQGGAHQAVRNHSLYILLGVTVAVNVRQHSFVLIPPWGFAVCELLVMLVLIRHNKETQ